MPDTAEFTSGEIAAAEKPLAEASPAQHTQVKTDTADASTRATPVTTETVIPEVTRIPLPDHERIVDGFHRRLDEIAWAKGLKREDVEEAMALRRRLIAQQSRSEESAEPRPDSKSAETGEVFYSPQRAAEWAVWKANQIVDERMGDLEGRLGPIERDRAQASKIETLSAQISAASSWPGFSDNVDDVTKAIATANSRGEKLSLHDAYIAVVVPKLAASRETLEPEIRKAVLAELNKTTTRAQDDLNPSRIPARSRKDDKDRSFKDLVPEVSESLRTRSA